MNKISLLRPILKPFESLPGAKVDIYINSSPNINFMSAKEFQHGYVFRRLGSQCGAY